MIYGGIMKNKEIREKYQDLSVGFLLDYFIFTDNTDEMLEQAKSYITTSNFLENLKIRIEKMKEHPYPEKTRSKIETILDYIEENSSSLDKELDDCFDALENLCIFSDDKYVDEFLVRQDFLNEENKNQYIAWNLKELENSICYDYVVLMSFSASQENYINHYMDNFILNRNYIYSIKKIHYVFQELFEDSEVKKRTLDLLKLDLKLLENYDNEVLVEYVRKNYQMNNKQEIILDLKDLERMKQEIITTIDTISHSRGIFDMELFSGYYDMLKIENMLENKNQNLPIYSVNSIYSYIEQIQNEKLTKEEKNKLIDILATKKNELKDHQEYNHYLVQTNQIPETKTKKGNSIEISCRTDLWTVYKLAFLARFFHQYDEYEEILLSQKYDLKNFESYLLSDEEFEKHKEEYYNTYYCYTIGKFLKEAPWMFYDLTVYQRTIEILNHCSEKGTKKIIKKLEKLKKR